MDYDVFVEELEEEGNDYLSEMKAELKLLSAENEKARNKFAIAVLISLIPISICIYYAFVSGQRHILYALFPIAMILGFLKLEDTEIDENVKEKLMSRLCKKVGFKYNFKPADEVIIPYRGLSIVPGFDYINLEDGISGEIRGINFNLIEADLEVYDKIKSLSNRRSVFKGILADFDYHRSFSGATLVTINENVVSNALSNILKVGEKVTLEDPEFEKKYKVFSTDQIQARYLLTPKFMQRMLDFSKRLGNNNLQLAFHDGKIFISLERVRNYFEGGNLQYHNPDYIRKNITDLTIVYYLIDQLNLTQETKI